MVRFDYGLVLIENLKKAGLPTSQGASVRAGGFIDAKAVARKHKLSPSLMEKVAQDFRRAGWLESRRGCGGGYRLAKNEISVSDVINFFELPYKICPINRIIKNKI